MSQLQSLTVTVPRRKRTKPKLKLKIINQNSVAVLQTPPDAQSEHSRDGEMDDSRGSSLLLACLVSRSMTVHACTGNVPGSFYFTDTCSAQNTSWRLLEQLPWLLVHFRDFFCCPAYGSSIL